jgi:hypothetical protein
MKSSVLILFPRLFCSKVFICAAFEKMNSGEYLPRSPQELAYFDALWNAANPGGVGDLTGATAVDFFRKSGVDIGILKSIWSLSTPLATMNQKQFYTALRYIVMAQNGDFPISRGSNQSNDHRK